MSENRRAGGGPKATRLMAPGEREILTERVFDAPRDRVVAAFTDPQLISRWWGLAASETRVELLELRAGGSWRFVERNREDGRENAFRGVYREVALPERLVYTFEWEGLPGHVVVNTVTFEDLGRRTRVRAHSLFHTRAERDGMLDSGMERGLSESYRTMDELLATAGGD